MGYDVPIGRETGLNIKNRLVTNLPETVGHKIPILGKIAAGLPIVADEYIIGYTYTERNGDNTYFALQVEGDSMNAARIDDGDIIIIRKTPQVENGEIAAVMVNDENATIKKYRQEGNIVHLIPWSNNPVHDIQIYNLRKDKIRIIGKVVETRIPNEEIEYE